MKILMLVPYLPTITMSGGQTRWYNIIKYLAKEHDITLFSLIKDESEKKLIPELEKYCKKVIVFKRPSNPWTLRNILFSFFGPFPLLVIRNLSLEERRAITKELENHDYDLIHAETFYVMPHLKNISIPTILVEQTIWHNVYRHHVMTKVNKFLWPFYLLDVYKVRFWEKYYWRKATRVFAVSSDDRDEMLRLIPEKRVGIIPNGVDSKFYAKKPRKILSPPRILYGVTNFEWLQNQEATEELIFNVWPSIKLRFPGYKVWIAGRKIPDWLKKRAKKGDVDITEDIADARDAYCKSYLMLAPIRGAGGTRLKILEAMASGLPVVSTSVGVSGLNLTDNENVLIADTDKGLADKAIELLENKKFAEKIGRKGQLHVKKYFDWKSVVKLHDPIYKSLSNSHE